MALGGGLLVSLSSITPMGLSSHKQANKVTDLDLVKQPTIFVAYHSFQRQYLGYAWVNRYTFLVIKTNYTSHILILIAQSTHTHTQARTCGYK